MDWVLVIKIIATIVLAVIAGGLIYIAIEAVNATADDNY